MGASVHANVHFLDIIDSWFPELLSLPQQLTDSTENGVCTCVSVRAVVFLSQVFVWFFLLVINLYQIFDDYLRWRLVHKPFMIKLCTVTLISGWIFI